MTGADAFGGLHRQFRANPDVAASQGTGSGSRPTARPRPPSSATPAALPEGEGWDGRASGRCGGLLRDHLLGRPITSSETWTGCIGRLPGEPARHEGRGGPVLSPGQQPAGRPRLALHGKGSATRAGASTPRPTSARTILWIVMPESAYSSGRASSCAGRPGERHRLYLPTMTRGRSSPRATLR